MGLKNRFALKISEGIAGGLPINNQQSTIINLS